MSLGFNIRTAELGPTLYVLFKFLFMDSEQTKHVDLLEGQFLFFCFIMMIINQFILWLILYGLKGVLIKI